jgi:hypothetical protein
MSLLDILRGGVEIANQQTKSLQAKVKFEKYVSSGGSGEAIYKSAVYLDAIVEWKQKQVRTMGGTLDVSRASVLFIDIAQLLKATNKEGVDDNDRITLPGGETGPILDMSGFIDAGTKIPIATEVFLG